MRIRITYPGDPHGTGSLYSEGQARFEEINIKGELIRCRFATPEEVMWWDQLCAAEELTRTINVMIDVIHGVQTYGVRIQK